MPAPCSVSSPRRLTGRAYACPQSRRMAKPGYNQQELEGACPSAYLPKRIEAKRTRLVRRDFALFAEPCSSSGKPASALSCSSGSRRVSHCTGLCSGDSARKPRCALLDEEARKESSRAISSATNQQGVAALNGVSLHVRAGSNRARPCVGEDSLPAAPHTARHDEPRSSGG